MWIAAEYDNADVVALLADKGKADVNAAANVSGCSVLIMCRQT